MSPEYFSFLLFSFLFFLYFFQIYFSKKFTKNTLIQGNSCYALHTGFRGLLPRLKTLALCNPIVMSINYSFVLTVIRARLVE